MYFLIALAALCAASYFDLKSREIPRALTYSLFFIGIALHGADSFLSGSIIPIADSITMAIASFLFAYSFYKLGVWAGGDVKLFTALGAVLPTIGNVQAAPFAVLFLSLVAVFPFLIIYCLYFVLTMSSIRRSVALALRQRLKRMVISAFLLFAVSSLIQGSISPFLLVYSIIVSALFFTAAACYSELKKRVLRFSVRAAELEEGMIPAKDVVVKGKLLASARMARGLTQAEIRALRRAGIKEVLVRKSLPFVPVIALGLVLLYALLALLPSLS